MREPWKWLAQHGFGWVVIVASYLTIFLYIVLGIVEAVGEWWRDLPVIKREVSRWRIEK